MSSTSHPEPDARPELPTGAPAPAAASSAAPDVPEHPEHPEHPAHPAGARSADDYTEPPGSHRRADGTALDVGG